MEGLGPATSLNAKTSFSCRFVSHHLSKVFDKQKSIFIGRNDLKIKFLNQLLESKDASGCYLVAGYRGIGKTSFINWALEDYEGKLNDETLIRCDVMLGDETKRSKRDLLLEFSNVLKTSLINYLKKEKTIHKRKVEDIDSFSLKREGIVLLSFLFFFVFFSLLIWEASLNADFKWSLSSLLFNFTLSTFLLLSFTVTLKKISSVFFFLKNRHLIESIRDLTRLELASNSSEKSTSSKEFKGFKFLKFGGVVGSETNRKQIDTNAIKLELSNILKNIRQNADISKENKLDVVFVIDELDKLKYSATNVDEGSNINFHPQEALLSELKGFLTTTSARYIFVSDRELLDRYYNETTSEHPLYDGIFDNIFYVRSLITDSDFGKNAALHRPIEQFLKAAFSNEKKSLADNKNPFNGLDIQFESEIVEDSQSNDDNNIEKANTKYILKRYIEYLTIFSWGNPRRLNSLLRENVYMEPEIGEGENKNRYFLLIKNKDFKKLVFASKIYHILDNYMANHLSRSDDKLVVSTIIFVHEILRFNDVPFTMQYLSQVARNKDSSATPIVSSSIQEVMGLVFNQLTRRILNGIFDYRFITSLNEEIRELSRIHGAQVSSLNYRSQAPVYFENVFSSENPDEIIGSYPGAASKLIALGDQNFWSENYDAAIEAYDGACKTLLQDLRISGKDELRKQSLPSFTAQYQLCRILLKIGLIHELRQNYRSAIRSYRWSIDVAKEFFSKDNVKREEQIQNSLASFWTLSKSKNDYRDMFVISVICIETVSLKLGYKGRKDVTKSLPDLKRIYFDEDNQKVGFETRESYSGELLNKMLIVKFISNEFIDVLECLNPLKSYYDLVSQEENSKDLYFNYSETMLLVLWAQTKLIEIIEKCKTPEDLKTLFLLIRKSEGMEVRKEFQDIINLLLNCGKRLKQLGYKTRATYIYIHIISIWSQLVENYVTVSTTSNFSSHEVPKIVIDSMNLMHKTALSSDEFSTYNRRDYWLSQDLKNDELPKRYTSEVIDVINGVDTDRILKKEKDKEFKKLSSEDVTNMLSLFSFWHRTPLEMAVFCTEFRFKRLLRYFGEKCHLTNPITGGVNLLRQIGLCNNPRFRSSLYNNTAKLEIDYLKSLLNSKDIDEVAKISESKEAILSRLNFAMLSLAKAFANNVTSSINGHPLASNHYVSFYIDFYELLTLDERFKYSGFIRKNLFDNKYFDDLDKEYRLPRVIRKKKLLLNAIESELEELRHFRSRDSKVFKRVLRGKYFLYDDFDDPTFKIDWISLKILSWISNHSHRFKEMQRDTYIPSNVELT